MSMIKWTPLKELEDMRRDMDRLFEEFFGPSSRRRRWPARPDTELISPNIDLYDRQNEIVLKAELPGVSREDIDITIIKDAIILKGQLMRDEDVKDEQYYVRERVFGSFSRTLALPTEVESEKTSASFKNGVLEIVMPKKEEAKIKEIKVDVK
jgi:HSP20 family protein